MEENKIGQFFKSYHQRQLNSLSGYFNKKKYKAYLSSSMMVLKKPTQMG